MGLKVWSTDTVRSHKVGDLVPAGRIVRVAVAARSKRRAIELLFEKLCMNTPVGHLTNYFHIHDTEDDPWFEFAAGNEGVWVGPDMCRVDQMVPVP